MIKENPDACKALGAGGNAHAGGGADPKHTTPGTLAQLTLADIEANDGGPT